MLLQNLRLAKQVTCQKLQNKSVLIEITELI